MKASRPDGTLGAINTGLTTDEAQQEDFKRNQHHGYMPKLQLSRRTQDHTIQLNIRIHGTLKILTHNEHEFWFQTEQDDSRNHIFYVQIRTMYQDNFGVAKKIQTDTRKGEQP
mmetsp:Transcript_11387/g.21605  ORF Transcript_11387/g.21605 Transcript_11387/m.21605 type:complete len:113 (-) Transcript_11387:12-350(-)